MKLIRKAFLLSVVGLMAIGVSAQGDIWQQLSNITYTKEYNEIMGFKVDIPVFAENIKSLEGTEIEIKGYIIPIEGYRSHKEFVFSAYPYSMCFFCGGAGPETVMEVFASEPVKYTDDPIILRGKLELNSQDINRLIYALNDARVVEKEKE